jgi:hypothetical protein
LALTRCPTDFSDPQRCTAAPAFSPNGLRLACVADAELVIRNASTLEAEATLACAAPLSQVRWSPDSSYLFGLLKQGSAANALVWDAEAGTLLAQITNDAAPVVCARWAPCSREVLMCVGVAAFAGALPKLTRRAG